MLLLGILLPLIIIIIILCHYIISYYLYISRNGMKTNHVVLWVSVFYIYGHLVIVHIVLSIHTVYTIYMMLCREDAPLKTEARKLLFLADTDECLSSCGVLGMKYHAEILCIRYCSWTLPQDHFPELDYVFISLSMGTWWVSRSQRCVISMQVIMLVQLNQDWVESRDVWRAVRDSNTLMRCALLLLCAWELCLIMKTDYCISGPN